MHNRVGAEISDDLFTRRSLLRSAALAAPSLFLPSTSHAAAFPERDINFIIPYGPGGGYDAMARIVAGGMQKNLHSVNVLPVNISAGGGGKGISQLYRARPDGHTIGVLSVPGILLLKARLPHASFDPKRFTWLARIGVPDEYTLAVPANSPIRSLDDLLALSRKRPVRMTSVGPEGGAYISTLIAARILGLRTQLITGYKGSADYIVAVLRGDGEALVISAPAVKPFVKTGKLRVLLSFAPHNIFPGAPNSNDIGKPELQQLAVHRMLAGPPGIPPHIVQRLVAAANAAMTNREAQARALRMSVPLSASSPEAAQALLKQQMVFFEHWKSVLLAG